jgi:hypothetical protein
MPMVLQASECALSHNNNKEFNVPSGEAKYADIKTLEERLQTAPANEQALIKTQLDTIESAENVKASSLSHKKFLMGYNMELECLKLHAHTYDNIYTENQMKLIRKVETLNKQFDDLSKFNALLTKSLATSKRADLTAHAELLDRIRKTNPDLIQEKKSVWSSESDIKLQLDLLKEKLAHIPSEMNTIYMELGQGEKNIMEICKIFSDMNKQCSEEKKRAIANQIR